MRQTFHTVGAAALVLMLIGTILAIVSGGGTQAQHVLPTPKGQLGGPIPLPTSAPGQPQSSPTPAPTSTPAGSPTSGAEAQHVTDCRIPPRALDDIVALAVSDVPPAIPAVAAGVPAGEAMVDAVSATIHQLVACLNAGDQLRASALLSDDYLQRNLATIGWNAAEAANILGPLLPRPSERWMTIRDISGIQLLPDGRMRATVVLVDPDQFSIGPVTTRLFLFVREGDRWLVDAIVEG